MAEEGKKFTIKRLYIKDVSFESPDAPEVFRQRLEPKIEIVLSVGLAALGKELHQPVETARQCAAVRILGLLRPGESLLVDGAGDERERCAGHDAVEIG